MRLNFFQTLSRYPNEFAIRETRPEELLTPAKSVIIERNEGKTKGFDGNFNSFSLSRFQASFDHILPFPNERGRFHDVVHVFFLLSYFFLFCLTRSKERERGGGKGGDEKQGSRATQKSKVLQTNLNPGLKEKLDVHAFTLASLSSICPGFTSVHAGIIGSLFFVSKGSSSRLFLLLLFVFLSLSFPLSVQNRHAE